MSSFLLGLLGGFIAWIATEFVARPLAVFISLRTDAARVLSKYESRFNPDPEFSPTPQWLADRKAAYEECGAKLVAFALSNGFIARRLARFPLRNWRCHARNAGETLLSLSEAPPGTYASKEFEEQIERSLRLSYWPPPKRWWREIWPW